MHGFNILQVVFKVSKYVCILLLKNKRLFPTLAKKRSKIKFWKITLPTYIFFSLKFVVNKRKQLESFFPRKKAVFSPEKKLWTQIQLKSW